MSWGTLYNILIFTMALLGPKSVSKKWMVTLGVDNHNKICQKNHDLNLLIHCINAKAFCGSDALYGLNSMKSMQALQEDCIFFTITTIKNVKTSYKHLWQLLGRLQVFDKLLVENAFQLYPQPSKNYFWWLIGRLNCRIIDWRLSVSNQRPRYGQSIDC